MKTKLCKICNKKFIKTGKNQKYCKQCAKTVKQEYIKKWNKENKDYQKEYKAKYRKENSEKYKKYHRKYRLKKRYGLTPKDRQYMFDKQEGRCAICQIHQDELNHILGVDHNHKTGRVRQLVCNRCNNLIATFEYGFYGFRDKIRDYLERNNG